MFDRSKTTVYMHGLRTDNYTDHRSRVVKQVSKARRCSLERYICSSNTPGIASIHVSEDSGEASAWLILKLNTEEVIVEKACLF
jgi:hypothetical protein